MARDSRTGRFTRPRIVGTRRRLQVVGVEYGADEVGGVRSAAPIVLGGQPAGRQVAEPEPTPAPKASRSRAE